MKYISIDNKDIVDGVSDCNFSLNGKDSIRLINDVNFDLLGKRSYTKLRVAMICNWNAECGISTYSKFLADALRPKVAELAIFSEENGQPNEENVFYDWKRGESLRKLSADIKKWNPDYVLIQHEFGLYPKAGHFLKLLTDLDKIPYAVILHSTYKHLDKLCCTSAIKNIIVHTKEAKEVLMTLGNSANITVIPHGCVTLPETGELWNIFKSDYLIIQFGFGFFYKGVDRAIKAIHRLKQSDPKFKDILYCYLCSENKNNTNTHNTYHEHLNKLIDECDLNDNVIIIRKFHTSEAINAYLRTGKIAIFPYLVDENNVVYGASGAIRIAMANNVPIIASESHLFDDLDGIAPRPTNDIDLASEIDKIFSDESYRNKIKDMSAEYVKNNSWDITAERYIDLMKVSQVNR